MVYNVCGGRSASTMRDDSDAPNAVASALLPEVGLHVSPEDVLGVVIWRRTFLNIQVKCVVE